MRFCQLCQAAENPATAIFAGFAGLLPGYCRVISLPGSAGFDKNSIKNNELRYAYTLSPTRTPSTHTPHNPPPFRKVVG